MKRLLPFLLLFLLGACSSNVEVTISTPADYAANGWDVYGVDTVLVTLHPYRDVYTLELLIDSAVVGVDTFPGPTSGFEWDVTQLREGGVHRLQARATSGTREYLSAEVLATVGYRSRLLVDGPGDSLLVYRPDGKRDTAFVPLDGAAPSCPRFRPGCGSCVFLAHHNLYEVAVPTGQAQLLDSVGNGIYSCDASPVSDLVAFEAYPGPTAHLFIKAGANPSVQLTHDSDFVLIDSSRFTCIANSNPVFSPDGERLAFYRKSKCLVPGDPHENETREDVFVMSRNGTNLVNLTSDVGDSYFSGFTWTFDGKWVLFETGRGETPDGVFAATADGTKKSQPGVAAIAMACSPLDSTLVYVSTELTRRLYTGKLVWTTDTLYLDGGGLPLSGDSDHQRKYLDWVRLLGQ